MLSDIIPNLDAVIVPIIVQDVPDAAEAVLVPVTVRVLETLDGKVLQKEQISCSFSFLNFL